MRTIGCLAAFWLLLLLPSYHWLDTAELTLAGASLGVGHPPGQVPHALLAYLFSLVPFGSLPLRVSLLSWASSLAAVAAVLRWIHLDGSKKGIGRLLVLAVAFSLPVSFQAVRSEVYSLVAALVLWSAILSRECSDARFLRLSWFLFGLACVIHPLIALGTLPFLWRKGMWQGVPFAALPALLLLYLSVRASALPIWNFGDPHHWERFDWFVRGKLYKAYDTFEFGRVWSNALGLGEILASSIAIPGLVAFWIGILETARKDRGELWRWMASLGWFLGTLLFMGNFWPSNPDAWGYLVPALWMMTAIGAIGVEGVLERTHSRAGVWGLRTLVWLAVVSQLFQTGDLLRLREDWSAREHAKEVLAETAPSSGVAFGSFSTFSLTETERYVEGARPDIKVEYRGIETGASRRDSMNPNPQLWQWELAIDRAPDGRYTLRSEDLERIDQLKPIGWLCRIGGKDEPMFRQRLRSQSERILASMPEGLDYPREPLILNYMVHVLRAQKQQRVDEERGLLADARALFPGFHDFNLLEGAP